MDAKTRALLNLAYAEEGDFHEPAYPDTSDCEAEAEEDRSWEILGSPEVDRPGTWDKLNHPEAYDSSYNPYEEYSDPHDGRIVCLACGGLGENYSYDDGVDIPCTTCEGFGYGEELQKVACYRCDGDGEILFEDQDYDLFQRRCPVCDGSGLTPYVLTFPDVSTI